jgi:uncharacterized membrane protein (UPF0127 family)
MPSQILLDNETSPLKVLLNIKYCESFLCQLRGFTFRRQIGESEGLLLVQKKNSRVDSSIHMLFVFTPLAVFWINSDHIVVHKTLALPWRLAYFSPKPAMYVLELNPKHVNLFEIGHKVKFLDG